MFSILGNKAPYRIPLLGRTYVHRCHVHVPFIGQDDHLAPYIRYRIVVLGLILGAGRPIWALYQIQDGYLGTFIGYEDHTGPYIRL